MNQLKQKNKKVLHVSDKKELLLGDNPFFGVDNLSQIKDLIKSAKPINFGITEDFSCSDLDLINPQNWKLN